MERLTKKDDFFDYVLPEQNIFGDNQAFEISLGKTEYTCKLHITGEAIKRFGELEDVLEKYNIENIEDLKLRLEDVKYCTYQANKQLQHKLEVAERALELACELRDDWGGREYSGTEYNNYYDYFIALAEKELKE